MKMSQAAFDLIVREEIGDEAYYNKTERMPDWPGSSSGVTIGIGYDCGYETVDQIKSDWSGKLPENMVEALCAVAGIHGSAASARAKSLHGTVNVPLDVATDVFRNRDVPKWEATVTKALANTDKLSGESFGALVSLAFNRGASFHTDGDRYREMREIADLMKAERFAEIPAQFRAMKRLWPNVQDLRDRRDHEAVLFEAGLKAAPAPAEAPTPATPALAPVTPATATEVPAWLQTMRSLTGVTAAKDNSEIVGWAHKVGELFPNMASYCAEYRNDATAWCGVTAGYCMAVNGIRPPFGATDVERFFYALSWRTFGTDARHDPQTGDMLVFDFGGGDHHVTMLSRIEGDNYVCLGGNQSHSVKESVYHKSQCIAVRRPPAPAKPAPAPVQAPAVIPHVNTDLSKKPVQEPWWQRIFAFLFGRA